MYQGAELALLRLVGDGMLSIGRAVELLDSTYMDFHNLANRYGIELGATGEQSAEAMEKYGHLIGGKEDHAR